MNTLPLGTIISGTLRNEDLKTAFFNALNEVDQARAHAIKEQEFGSDMDYIVNELYGALNEYCPAFCYFGSHMGDGSDLGVWVDTYSVMEAVENKELRTFQDLAGVDVWLAAYGEVPKLALITSGHGNMTLYAIGIEVTDCCDTIQVDINAKEIWSVV